MVSDSGASGIVKRFEHSGNSFCAPIPQYVDCARKRTSESNRVTTESEMKVAENKMEHKPRAGQA